MAHFAIICRSDAGHIYPLTTIGSELQKRGHRVTLVNHHPDLEAMAEKRGLEWFPLKRETQQSTRLDKSLATLRWCAGGFVLRRFTSGKAALSYPRRFLAETPEALRELAADGILADATCQSIGTVAEYLDLPFVSVSSLPSNWEPAIPPIFTTWPYGDTRWRRLKNRMAYRGWHLTYRRKLNYINRRRKAWGLKPHRCYNDPFSRLAQIAQVVEAFDFPRLQAPESLHYVGALSDSSDRIDIPFPWDRLNGRSLIYATLGTVRGNQRADVFRRIAMACEGLDAQLVISLGRWLANSRTTQQELEDLPGNPIVADFVPQWPIIQRSSLVVNVGGLNTTMDALRNGVPMVVLPMSANQPGVAARLVRTGAGLMVPGCRATLKQIRAAIVRVLEEPAFRENAQRLQSVLAKAGGASRAAEIAETALLSGKLVPRERFAPTDQAATASTAN